MAAISEAAPRTSPPELVDLRYLGSQDLSALLEEESKHWRKLLDWDFTKSAELVRRFVDLRALNGFALLSSHQVVGYCYYVVEDYKALIGDLYITPTYATVENENRMLDAMVHAMAEVPHLTRVESQLIMMNHVWPRSLPAARHAAAYERNFMLLKCAQAPEYKAGAARPRIYLETWSEHFQEAAAQLIATSYVGHVDGAINDQYRSASGARRFLYNIVQYPGCGTFFRPASFCAFDSSTGRMCALCLASMVSDHGGHITQVCAAPWARGCGVGYEVMRSSVDALRQAGCESVSLTVTASNESAVRLYRGMGFETVRRFHALIWDGI
jgi:ribosomal protein S18 acetylase RimI-like enzyme